jgi:hypothetical protein
MITRHGAIYDIMFFILISGGLLLLFAAMRKLGMLHCDWMHRRRPDRAAVDSDGAGYLVSSALALLGLLIGFTFSMAVQRFDERRHAVVEEANAISTVYGRAGLFDEPIASELQLAIARYAKDRRDFVAAGEDAAALATVAKDLASTQDAIWAIMKRALQEDETGMYATATLTSMNEMFDLASTRQALIEAHIPHMVMFVLIGFAAATAYLLGYGAGHGGFGHGAATTIVFALVAIAIALIIDLDRPRLGFVKVDQDPMERIIVTINPAQRTPVAP